jgi:fatty acid desaturase
MGKGDVRDGDQAPAEPPGREWKPSRTEAVAMSVIGMVLTVVGGVGFLWLRTQVSQTAGLTFGGLELIVGILGAVVLTLLLSVIHELVHGVAVKLLGGRPSYGAGMMHKLLPYFYCTAEGHRFTRGQFAVVALAPFVVVNLAMAAALASPWGWWFVVPAALHLGGCVGDLWMVAVVAKQPRGTLVEDQRDGVRFHPAA